MKDIQCFVFDFGNVVAFFDHGKACRQLAKLTKNCWSGEEIYKQMFQAGGLEEQYDLGKISTPDFLNRIKQQFSIDADNKDVEDAWCNIFWLNKSIVQLLSRLKAKSYKLILASNTNELHYKWCEKNFKEVLGDKEVCGYFEFKVLSYDIKHRKPDIEFFDKCIEASGCNASQCVYVDDREDFVNVALEIGMNGILVDDLIYRLQEFGIDDDISLEKFSVPVIQAKYLEIYKEKYANFRHFDTLRWQIPQLVFVVGGAIASFAPRKEESYPPPWLLFLYGPFALLCAWLMRRVSYNMKLNTKILRSIAMRLGDASIPISPGRIGAAYWMEKFIWILGIVALVSGAYLYWNYIGAIAMALGILSVFVLYWVVKKRELR